MITTTPKPSHTPLIRTLDGKYPESQFTETYRKLAKRITTLQREWEIIFESDPLYEMKGLFMCKYILTPAQDGKCMRQWYEYGNGTSEPMINTWQFFGKMIQELNPRLGEIADELKILRAELGQINLLMEKLYDSLLFDDTKSCGVLPDFKQIKINLAKIGIDYDLYKNGKHYASRGLGITGRPLEGGN